MQKFTLTVIAVVVAEKVGENQTKSEDIHWRVNAQFSVCQTDAIFCCKEFWR